MALIQLLSSSLDSQNYACDLHEFIQNDKTHLPKFGTLTKDILIHTTSPIETHCQLTVFGYCHKFY